MRADLLAWNPVDALQRFRDTFGRLVSRWRGGSASMNSPTSASMGRVDEAYRVRIPLPGIAPENITVDVAARTIHVRALECDTDTEVTHYEEVLTLLRLSTPRRFARRSVMGSSS